MAIERAAVIGAGLMGSGIAAQIANAGVPVLLLDIVPKDSADRSAIAKGAIDKLLKADPAPLMSKAAAGLITPLFRGSPNETFASRDRIVMPLSIRARNSLQFPRKARFEEERG